jgi:hypothetical protein
MTVKHLKNLKVSLADLLKTAGPEGLLLECPGETNLAVLPLDDELIDFLLERNPKFHKDCQKIRQRMRQGQYHTHEEVKKLLG